jgi:hypothetical protein
MAHVKFSVYEVQVRVSGVHSREKLKANSKNLGII